ncbi:hypothetical protein [Thalassobacillus sp. C254]|uniref:hypothetical protein n=1 Tax=Thalassobacillus sp. C254 TaxID=1225341 RepID=UPI0012EEA2D7|nr:hypothetical protein [Thalassobacillus sp. C254]
MGSANQYAAASFKDRIQPPIFLSRDLFPKLMKLQGDQGARAVLRHDPLIKGVVIENDKWENFYDIDTKEEYQWIKEVKSH